MLRTGFDEVEEASTAIELGQEESSIGLRIRGLDPLKTRSNDAVLTAAFTQDSAAITAHLHYNLMGPISERDRDRERWYGEGEGEETRDGI